MKTIRDLIEHEGVLKVIVLLFLFVLACCCVRFFLLEEEYYAFVFFFYLFSFFFFFFLFCSLLHNPEKSNFCGHLGWALFFFFSGLINANAIFQWSTGDGR